MGVKRLQELITNICDNYCKYQTCENDPVCEKCPLETLKEIEGRLIGYKPKYHKGIHIRSYYTCGQCGATIGEIIYNYCNNCGYRIKWDNPRCLTDQGGGVNDE